MTWRTHSCVPCRHSWRHPTFLQPRGAGRSAGPARKSACATSATGELCTHGGRFVVPKTFLQGVVSRSCRCLWIAKRLSAGRSACATTVQSHPCTHNLRGKRRRASRLKIGRRINSCPTTDDGLSLSPPVCGQVLGTVARSSPHCSRPFAPRLTFDPTFPRSQPMKSIARLHDS